MELREFMYAYLGSVAYRMYVFSAMNDISVQQYNATLLMNV